MREEAAERAAASCRRARQEAGSPPCRRRREEASGWIASEVCQWYDVRRPSLVTSAPTKTAGRLIYAATGSASKSVASAQGSKYIPEGRTGTPGGQTPLVRTIWRVAEGLPDTGSAGDGGLQARPGWLSNGPLWLQL